MFFNFFLFICVNIFLFKYLFIYLHIETKKTIFHHLKNNKMTALELKIGDTFKRQGIKFTVQNIEQETYKNGTPSLLVSCTANNSKVVDSFFHFKLTTKVK